MKHFDIADESGHIVTIPSMERVFELIQQGKLLPRHRTMRNNAPAETLGEIDVFSSLFSQLCGEGERRNKDPLSGRSGVIEVVGALGHLARTGRSGRIFMGSSHAASQTVITIRDGLPIAVESDDPETLIGQILRVQGWIDESQLENALERRLDHDTPLGATLVEAGHISIKQLRTALSIQSVQRMVQATQNEENYFRFVESDTSREEERFTISVTDLMDTILGVHLEPGAIASELYSADPDPAFEPRIETRTNEQLSEADTAILKQLASGRPLSALLNRLMKSMDWNQNRIERRILILKSLGVISVAGVESEKLKSVLKRIQKLDYFRLFSVRRSSTEEELINALERKLEEFGALENADDTPSVKKVRSQIAEYLESAHAVLVDPTEKSIYSRALQMGQDFNQPDVRRKLRQEYLVSRGKSLLASEEYEGAIEALEQALKAGSEDPVIHISLGWAQFLASDRANSAASDAIARVEVALKIEPASDHAHLTIGKIYRLMGDMPKAKKHLGKATEINGDNHEAWAQLRLLNQRKASPGVQLKMEFQQGLASTLFMALLTLGVLYAGANVVGGGATQWPDVSRASSAGADSSSEKALAERVRLRLQGEVETAVPDSQRVQGNIEYYYLADDSWFWMRRGLLLFLAFLGIFALNREKGSEIPVLGENSGWVLLAIPYGLIIGFLSIPPQTPTPYGTLMGMTAVHVVAEQLFFMAFVGRSLLKAIPEPVPAIVLTGLIFGLHQLTFFATLNAPVQSMLTGTLQVAAFGGGAYGFLLWRSGGIMAPMVAHLVVHATMMSRAVLVNMG